MASSGSESGVGWAWGIRAFLLEVSLRKWTGAALETAPQVLRTWTLGVRPHPQEPVGCDRLSLQGRRGDLGPLWFQVPTCHPRGSATGRGCPVGSRGVPDPGGWSGPRPRGSALPPHPPAEATSCASVSLACTTRNLTATESQSGCAHQRVSI